MKIYKWLADPMSARVGLAIVEVLPGEIADIEYMGKLIDGDYVGHFGLSARLLSEGEAPRVEVYSKLGNKRGVETFGHSPISTYQDKSRFYEVHVSRD